VRLSYFAQRIRVQRGVAVRAGPLGRPTIARSGAVFVIENVAPFLIGITFRTSAKMISS
jgi:hypothetical protein